MLGNHFVKPIAGVVKHPSASEPTLIRTPDTSKESGPHTKFAAAPANEGSIFLGIAWCTEEMSSIEDWEATKQILGTAPLNNIDNDHIIKTK